MKTTVRNLFIVVLTLWVLPAVAAVFDVDRNDDTADAAAQVCSVAANDCSLRGAILKANAAGGPDVVNLQADTYTLSIPGANPDDPAIGDLDIEDDVTLIGAGAAQTTIDGNGGVTIDRVFDVLGGRTFTLSGVTVTGGKKDAGAGLRNFGTAAISDSIFTANIATSSGGAIAGNGTMTLTNVDFTGNDGGLFGGAIDYTGNTLTVTGGTFDANTAGALGGAVHVSSGVPEASFDGVSFTANVSQTSGGAIANDGNVLSVTGCVFSGNDATTGVGGAVSNGGAPAVATITASTLSGNTSGGGGAALANLSGTLNVIRSTVSGNQETSGGNFGGGCLRSIQDGTINLINSTFSGNSSNSNGGCLSLDDGTVNLTNVTIADNTADIDANGSGNGGGIFILGVNATVNIQNSLVAGNVDGSLGAEAPDCFATLESQGHNVIQNTTGCTIANNTTGNLIGQDPQIGALADNGGPTQTRALQASSPAIDAGDDSVCVGALATDQRGVVRYGGCDIGAYEFAGSCGDGLLQMSAGEICDDGNAVSGDGCDANCTVTACGNGVTSAPEACDDANAIETDACLTTCQSATCGDGFGRTGVEGCDDGNVTDGDGCSAACAIESPAGTTGGTNGGTTGGTTGGTAGGTTGGDTEPTAGGCSLSPAIKR